MTTADDYINRVLASMPRATPLRSQIALELRGHIAERVNDGHALGEVLRQLGDPERLAESYLSAVPLVSAPFGRRALAKIVDVVTVLAFVGLGAAVWRFATSDGFAAWLIVIFGGSVCFGLYTMVAEARFGETVGKHLLGLRVVRESGTQIGVGQAVVRQLPMLLQVYWIDALFALFTERSQRAFELLSKTRVVRIQN